MVSQNVLADVTKTIDTQKGNWPPFKAGLFGPDYDAFMETIKEYLTGVAQTPWF
jgi:hypothetical protein